MCIRDRFRADGACGCGAAWRGGIGCHRRGSSPPEPGSRRRERRRRRCRQWQCQHRRRQRPEQGAPAGRGY
eukprot:4399095-Prymnesium_polylepis.1